MHAVKNELPDWFWMVCNMIVNDLLEEGKLPPGSLTDLGFLSLGPVSDRSPHRVPPIGDIDENGHRGNLFLVLHYSTFFH